MEASKITGKQYYDIDKLSCFLDNVNREGEYKDILSEIEGLHIKKFVNLSGYGKISNVLSSIKRGDTDRYDEMNVSIEILNKNEILYVSPFFLKGNASMMIAFFKNAFRQYVLDEKLRYFKNDLIVKVIVEGFKENKRKIIGVTHFCDVDFLLL